MMSRSIQPGEGRMPVLVSLSVIPMCFKADSLEQEHPIEI